MSDPKPIPETANIMIPWPTVAPLGVTVSAEGLHAAWESVWVPIYAEHQSIEHRMIAGVLRAVYDGMHGITNQPDGDDGHDGWCGCERCQHNQSDGAS